jgi:hypothetical protein
VQRMLRQHERRERDHRKPLWTLLVLELWRREKLARRAEPATARRS